jgi:hypothetical protein
MRKWEVKPELWNTLTLGQQKKMYRSGVRLSIKVMIGLVIGSLLIETVLGL